MKCLAQQSVILVRRLIRCLATDLGAEPLEFVKHHSGMFTGHGNNATAIASTFCEGWSLSFFMLV